MGNKVNQTTPVTTPVKVIDETLEHHGHAGYVVEPPLLVDGALTEVGVKLDIDSVVYYFGADSVETLV
jgi:hypothetical protein